MNRLSVPFVLLLHSSVFGQVWDFATWQGAKVSGEVMKKLSISVEEQLRLENNSSYIDEVFTEVGVGYDLPKGFGISAAYRFSLQPRMTGELRTGHRYNLDVSYSKKFWKLRGKLKARYQHRPSPYLTNDRLEPESGPVIIRLKCSIEYADLKKWTPGIEFEAFALTNDPFGSGFNRYRYRIFLERDLPKRQDLAIFYILQTDYSREQPMFTSIVGLNYSYEWKRPKRKKKD